MLRYCLEYVDKIKNLSMLRYRLEHVYKVTNNVKSLSMLRYGLEHVYEVPKYRVCSCLCTVRKM